MEHPEIPLRDKQLLPYTTGYFTYMQLAGRGFGKTRSLSSAVITKAMSNTVDRILLISPTATDIREVLIEGSAGIRQNSPSYFKPTYEPSKKRVIFPNGCVVNTFSGDDPESLRGFTAGFAAVDELCRFRYADYCLTMIKMCLRERQKEESIRMMICTTPKPLKCIRELLEDPTTYTVRGTTYENTSLDDMYIKHMHDMYNGTRLGQQELLGELLLQSETALYSYELIDKHRVEKKDEPKEYLRTIVAVDPAVSSNKKSDESGIIVAGVSEDDNVHIIADYTGRYSPDALMKKIDFVFNLHHAGMVLCETNQGGDLLESLLATVNKNIPYQKKHHHTSKTDRASKVVHQFERGKVKLNGFFSDLEEQMTSWDANSKYSPDRLDAMNMAVTFLLNLEHPPIFIGRA